MDIFGRKKIEELSKKIEELTKKLCEVTKLLEEEQKKNSDLRLALQDKTVTIETIENCGVVANCEGYVRYIVKQGKKFSLTERRTVFDPPSDYRELFKDSWFVSKEELLKYMTDRAYVKYIKE